MSLRGTFVSTAPSSHICLVWILLTLPPPLFCALSVLTLKRCNSHISLVLQATSDSAARENFNFLSLHASSILLSFFSVVLLSFVPFILFWGAFLFGYCWAVLLLLILLFSFLQILILFWLIWTLGIRYLSWCWKIHTEQLYNIWRR